MKRILASAASIALAVIIAAPAQARSSCQKYMKLARDKEFVPYISAMSEGLTKGGQAMIDGDNEERYAQCFNVYVSSSMMIQMMTKVGLDKTDLDPIRKFNAFSKECASFEDRVITSQAAINRMGRNLDAGTKGLLAFNARVRRCTK